MYFFQKIFFGLLKIKKNYVKYDPLLYQLSYQRPKFQKKISRIKKIIFISYFKTSMESPLSKCAKFAILKRPTIQINIVNIYIVIHGFRKLEEPSFRMC